MVKIKLFGLQRTCTNYIESLCKLNFGDQIAFCKDAWKHGPFHAHNQKEILWGDDTNIIVAVKNPYAWMFSCYNYWKVMDGIGPDLRNISFEEFVTASPVVLEGSSDVPYLFRASSLMNYYNNMYFHWLSIRDCNLCVIRYEDILNDFEKTLCDIARQFALKIQSYLTNIDTEIIWGEHNYTDEQRAYIESKAGKFTKKRFYLDEEYMDAYTDSMLKFIEMDWDYSLMSPERLDYKVKKGSVFEGIKIPPN